MDKLKRLRITKVIETSDAQEKGRCQQAEIPLQRPDSAVYLNVGSSLLGEQKGISLSCMTGNIEIPVCPAPPKMTIM